MLVLISHDVDHFGFKEHARDGIAWKFAIRSLLEVSSFRIGLPVIYARWKRARADQWHNIDALLDFNEAEGIPSTFFVGVENGLGLSYSLEASELIIQKILRRGFEAGVHGIAYDDPVAIRRERSTFADLIGHDNFGIRMHYLRMVPRTLGLLLEAGYLFDATEMRPGGPFLFSGMPELPLSVMDGRLVETCPFGIQVRDFRLLMHKTRLLVEKAERDSTGYFSLLFHDRYFSDEFPLWRNWYIETIWLLKSRGHEFLSHARMADRVRRMDMKFKAGL